MASCLVNGYTVPRWLSKLIVIITIAVARRTRPRMETFKLVLPSNFLTSIVRHFPLLLALIFLFP